MLARVFSKLTLTLLAAVWLPAQSHCLLERTDWIAADKCCARSDAPAEPAPAAPCSDRVCCLLDSPTYRVDEEQPLLPAPVGTPAVQAPAPQSVSPPRRLVPGPLTSSPPELAATWQFLCRAAMPPRAPSTAS